MVRLPNRSARSTVNVDGWRRDGERRALHIGPAWQVCSQRVTSSSWQQPRLRPAIELS